MLEGNTGGGIPSSAEHPKVFFVYKPLITLMTLRSLTDHFSIDHGDKDQNKVTAPRICAHARRRRWKRCEIQPLNCHLSEETTKGVNVIILPVAPQCLWADINMHVYAYKPARFHNLFWGKETGIYIRQLYWTLINEKRFHTSVFYLNALLF